jgi:short-subunit dehydrogenase
MRFGRRLLWGSVLGGGIYWLLRYFRPRHSTLVLNEKVVVITGASSGIGRALAFAFARRAAKLVLVARHEDRLEAVQREIAPYTSDVLVIPADVSDQEQLQNVVDLTLETFGRIDVLVNNAGIAVSGPVQNHSTEQVRRVVEVNLLSAIQLTRLVLPHMLKHNHGYILNISSGLGRTAMPMYATYTATKYGLAGFSDALRRELDRTGVYVTLALPGWTRTDMVTPEMEDLLSRYGYKLSDPDEVAERIVLGLVHGTREIVLGGAFEWAGVLAERYAPILVRLYWKLWYSPEWVSVMSQADRYSEADAR